eukprot:CFRG1404T1
MPTSHALSFPEKADTTSNISNVTLSPDEEEEGVVTNSTPIAFPDPDATATLPCCLCDVASCGRESILEHMALSHKLVIGGVERIANLKAYLEHWKITFATHKLTDFAFTVDPKGVPESVCIQKKEPSRKEMYFMLSDKLPADRQLRTALQSERLKEVLAVQEKERAVTDFKRKCLFCTIVVTGNRRDLFQHMLDSHFFNVGLPDNVVFADEFLNHLQAVLENLQCLSCEKTFKSQPVLRAHMRKKRHMKVNPNNAGYDKYYVVNYLETGRKWTVADQVQPSGNDSDTDATATTDKEIEAEEGWDDWEEEVSDDTTCLLCDKVLNEASLVFPHMTVEHGFDYRALENQHNWDFYQRIKVVNYIRRQMHLHRCPTCDVEGGNADGLKHHMQTNEHYGLPDDDAIWNQPQYFFPTFENDALLCVLDEDSDEEDDSAPIQT